jgi:peptide/nickel transport system permease protein
MSFDLDHPTDTASVVAAPAVAEPSLGIPGGTIRVRRRTRRAGLVLVIGWMTVLVLLAVLADVLPIDDPLRADPRAASVGPGWDHWFGTDTLGRDVFARSIHGARATLLIAFCSIALAAVAGSVLGAAAGYFRGRADAGIVIVMDALLAFPTLVFALALTAFLGASQRNVIIAITVVATPVFGRLARAQTLSYSQRDFVTSARSTGASDLRILFTEVAPNVTPSIVAYGLVLSAVAIVVEGSLSFLGLGVPPPTPTWGGMIAAGRGELDGAAHVVLIPTAVMFVTVLSLNVLGDRLRIHLDAPAGRR